MPKTHRTLDEIFSNLINVYHKTGRIGYARPVNLAHARKIAYCAALNILKKENKINNTVSPSSQPTEGLTGCQTCVQLKLF